MHIICQLTEIDHSVIRAVFHFLNSEAKNIVAVIPFEKKFVNFNLKIKANFYKTNYTVVRNILIANWANKECAEFFITKNFEKYESQLYAILEKIRYTFKKLPSNHRKKVDNPVNDPDYFEELSRIIIPNGEENDPRFMLTAKAMILYFFERGEFGKKTPNDPESLFVKMQ